MAIELFPKTSPDRLRIAIFSDSALPILNGVSISVDALIRELRNRGHSVTLFTAQQRGPTDPDSNTYRFRAIETPWTKGYPLAYPPFYRMLRKFRGMEFDLVHAHTPFTIGFVGLRWAESHNLPILATYHTLYDRYAHYIPLFPRRYVRFKIAKHTNYFFNRVNHVIAPSEAALRWLRRHSVTTPATVIPTGVAYRRPLDGEEVRQRLGIPLDQRVLLYVGRLAKEKNLRTLFEAAARVFERESAARLWLVGDGPYRAECHRIVRELQIGDRVRFVGFVPREEVDAYYAAADLFVFPSITETQGLVVQEAMSYGLPAVAVTGGGASEGIEPGRNGYVVKNDPETFADRILELLADDELFEAFSEEALRLQSLQGPERMCDQVLEVYGRVLAGRSLPEDPAPVSASSPSRGKKRALP